MSEDTAHDEIMTGDTPQAPRRWLAEKFRRSLNIKLMGAAGGLLLALLIAPGSRRLFLAQAGLTVPVPQNLASLSGSQLGIHPDPFYSERSFQVAHAAAERRPDDLQMQIANACAVFSEHQPPNSSPSELKVQRLRALEGRFPNSPSLYANILRYEAMGRIRPHHDEAQYGLLGEPLPLHTNRMAATGIDKAAYLAYDRDAAVGERLDPDNAYFPFMRAIGLFGSGHDDEALAAMTRAAQKTRWREYYNDEIRGQWRLQDTAFVNNSALFHALTAASTLFPQYAQMRGAVRVTLYTAMQAEQAGRVQEGLALRQAVVRLGSLMRVHSASLIGAIVGNAIAETAIERPGGLPAIRIIESGQNEAKEQAGREKRRQQFDAYLQRVGASGAAAAFHAEQQAGDAMRDIARFEDTAGPFDQPLQTLLAWWVADLVTLSNILWLLVLGALAALFLRSPALKAGLALPRYARLALPLGVIGGAFVMPSLLTAEMSPFIVQQITEGIKTAFLLACLAPILLLLALPASTGQERVRRLYAFACGMPFGAALAAFYVWQARGIVTMAALMQVFFNLGGAHGASATDLRSGLLWFTPCASFLVFLAVAILSRACRVPLSVGLARGFRGMAGPACAVLFLAYGGMLLRTIRAEAQVQYSLERTLDNEGQYLAELSGKPWPPAEMAAKRAGH